MRNRRRILHEIKYVECVQYQLCSQWYRDVAFDVTLTHWNQGRLGGWIDGRGQEYAIHQDYIYRLRATQINLSFGGSNNGQWFYLTAENGMEKTYTNPNGVNSLTGGDINVDINTDFNGSPIIKVRAVGSERTQNGKWTGMHFDANTILPEDEVTVIYTQN